MKKVLLTTLLILLFVFNKDVIVKAAKMDNIQANASMSSVSFDDLANLPIDETYSYEEVLLDMQNSGIFVLEDINQFKENHLKTIRASGTEEIRYSKFTMDAYTFIHGTIFLRRYELTPVFYGGLLYINGHPSPDKLVSLEGGHIKTSDGDNCVFGGSMFYTLEAGNRFYYGVYGNVYKSGSLTISAGAKVGVGESSFVSMSVSYTNDFIKNVDFDGRYQSAGLSP